MDLENEQMWTRIGTNIAAAIANRSAEIKNLNNIRTNEYY
jgi:hypothetical protein